MRIVCLTQRACWTRRASVGRSRRVVALVGCLALALLGTRTYADTDTALRHFDIQSQVAALALKEFARQADISLVFSSTVVANHQTTGIRGESPTPLGPEATAFIRPRTQTWQRPPLARRRPFSSQ